MAQSEMDVGAQYKQVEAARAEAETPQDMQAIIADYRALKEQGHARSAFRLGNIFARGTLVDPDPERAIDNYRTAVELGYVPAWRYLGNALLSASRGEEAAQAFAAAAENGVTGYELTAAKAHVRGDFGTASDPQMGIALLADLAESGDARARLELAKAFADPESGAADFSRSRDILEPLAAEGDPTAQEQLARLYRSGLGVERDYAKATELYLQAAESGAPRSLLRAADMQIRQGKWSEARATLENAVASGVPGAEMALARGHIRNSFRQPSSKAEGVRILEDGIAAGEIAPVLTSLYLLSEWRKFPADHRDLMARAERAADTGNAAAAAALIHFVRERPQLIDDPLGTRADLIARYGDLLNPRDLAAEEILYILDSNPERQAWRMVEEKLQGYDDQSYYEGLVAASRDDPNAFVYVLQKALKDMGLYSGSQNGRMYRNTLNATYALCRANDFYEECVHGPLRGTAVRLIAAVLTQARRGDT